MTAQVSTANLPTNIMDFRGFDSSIILILRGGILMSIGDFPEEGLSQATLVGIMSVGRVGVVSRSSRLAVPRRTQVQGTTNPSVVMVSAPGTKGRGHDANLSGNANTRAPPFRWGGTSITMSRHRLRMSMNRHRVAGESPGKTLRLRPFFIRTKNWTAQMSR